MASTEPAAELPAQPGSGLSARGVLAWVCLAACIPFAATGRERVLPLLVLIAAILFVSGRFGLRRLLERGWHFSDEDAPALVTLTRLYVVVCCLVVAAIAIQAAAWVVAPAASY